MRQHLLKAAELLVGGKESSTYWSGESGSARKWILLEDRGS